MVRAYILKVSKSKSHAEKLHKLFSAYNPMIITCEDETEGYRSVFSSATEAAIVVTDRVTPSVRRKHLLRLVKSFEKHDVVFMTRHSDRCHHMRQLEEVGKHTLVTSTTSKGLDGIYFSCEAMSQLKDCDDIEAKCHELFECAAVRPHLLTFDAVYNSTSHSDFKRSNECDNNPPPVQELPKSQSSIDARTLAVIVVTVLVVILMMLALIYIGPRN